VTATDANGDTLTYRISTNPTKGTAVAATNGTFTYTPTATARYLATQTVAPTSDLTDVFAVTVTDGYGGSATIPINVAVAAYSGNPTVGFSTAFQRVPEGDSGTTSAPLSVQLSTASATTVNVDYTIRPSGGTDQATAGVDFVAGTGTLTFAPGQTEVTLPVTIYEDTAYEGSEIITVELSNPTGAILVAYGAEGLRSDSTYLLIDNNDAPRSTAVASVVAATLP
jgi:VCBS repeat-containing protein